MKTINKVAAGLVILVYLVYHYDLLCALRKGKLGIESTGSFVTYISIHNSCDRDRQNKIHGMSKEGIHVVGLGKLRAESVHIGLIEDVNRIEKLKQLDESLKVMSEAFRYVGILTNGGTHKKPALTRLRDDLALEILGDGNDSNESNDSSDSSIDFSLVSFFKKYDMGRFLSMEHGCYMPYMMVYDTRSNAKVLEKIGKLNSHLKHTLAI